MMSLSLYKSIVFSKVEMKNINTFVVGMETPQ